MTQVQKDKAVNLYFANEAINNSFRIALPYQQGIDFSLSVCASFAIVRPSSAATSIFLSTHTHTGRHGINSVRRRQCLLHYTQSIDMVGEREENMSKSRFSPPQPAAAAAAFSARRKAANAIHLPKKEESELFRKYFLTFFPRLFFLFLSGAGSWLVRVWVITFCEVNF